MSEAVECIRCHTSMEAGYIPDVGYASCTQQRWAPGVPDVSFWRGLKVKQDQLIRVTTFRCPKCGYLESYARRVA